VSEHDVVHNHFALVAEPDGAACRFEIGQGVVYRPYPGAPAEDGTVLKVNAPANLVHVLYVGDRTAKATSADQLSSLTGDSR
jgi:hypothetical protein